MAITGKYCKAYLLKDLSQFLHWRKYTDFKDQELNDDVILYLQESYVVTGGIFVDENIVFNNVTSEWIDFCRNNLNFLVPVDV
jgi:hypothetical protein